MNREEMLRILQSVKKPLISLTAFYDGVTCEYMSSKGCGGFEILDWGDLDNYDYDAPDQTWDDLCDNELEEWINRLESEEFTEIEINNSN